MESIMFSLVRLRNTLDSFYELFSKALKSKLLNHPLLALIEFPPAFQNLSHLQRPFRSSAINKEPTDSIVADRLLRSSAVIGNDGDIAVHGLAGHNAEVLVCGRVEDAGCVTKEGLTELVRNRCEEDCSIGDGKLF